MQNSNDSGLGTKVILLAAVCGVLLWGAFVLAPEYSMTYQISYPLSNNTISDAIYYLISNSTPSGEDYDDLSNTYNSSDNYIKHIKSDYFGLSGDDDINCAAMLENDQNAIFDYINTTGRLTVPNDEDLEVSFSCEDIKQRIGYYENSNRGKQSIAFARNVYKSYALQEIFLAMTYSRKNYFCYSFDKNTTTKFKLMMRNLQGCLPNVFIDEQEYAFDSAGHYQDFAHVACMDILHKLPWDYLLLVQNNDLVTKNNEELSEIIETLGGAQATGLAGAHSYRYDTHANWTAEAMNLWKNKTGKTKAQLEANIPVTKTLNEVFLSKDFVYALMEELNLTTILDVFNLKKYYGGDEMLMASLTVAYDLGLPGQYQKRCPAAEGVVRYTQWNFGPSVNGCWSHFKRHGICILGVEYLKFLKTLSLITANKVTPDFDMGTVVCMAELLRNRSLGLAPTNGHNVFYENIPQVREMKARKLGNFNIETFNC